MTLPEKERIGEPAKDPEAIARAFHEAYERLAPVCGYETRRESAVPWDEVPAANRQLMVKTVTSLLHAGVITVSAECDARPDLTAEEIKALLYVIRIASRALTDHNQRMLESARAKLEKLD